MDILDKFFIKYSYKFPKGYPDLKDKQDILLLESILEELGMRVRVNEIGKLGSDAIMKYPYRIELFIKKFKEKTSFTHSKTGEDVILDKIIINNKEFTPNSDISDLELAIIDSKGKVKLYGDSLNGASLNSLAKTKEFGGGGGVRGGSTQTSLQESSQCLVNALAYKEGELSPQDLTEDNLKSVLKDVEVDVSDQDMLDFIINSPSWTNSLLGTANVLLKMFPNRGYTQHRQSQFVKDLYKHANTLIKEDSRLKGARIGLDKWNPSDIWMSSLNNAELLTQTQTLDDLNALILQLFVDKILIGVSLKKTDLTPKVQEFQVGEEAKDDTYEGHSDATTTTKSTFIFTSGPKVEFRTFGAPGFSGEIQGGKAGGGKIGLGPINTVLKVEGLPILKDLTKVNKEDFVKLYNTYAVDKLSGVEELNKVLSEKEKEIIKSGGGKGTPKGPVGANDWLISRNFGLQILTRFDEAKNKDKLLEGILRYAYSSSEWSSSYIKIH